MDNLHSNCFNFANNKRKILFSVHLVPLRFSACYEQQTCIEMFPHSLCPCFILIIYCFVKITDETLEEWFETTDSTAGEVASVLTTISSKHCSARQALSFYFHFWETKHLFFRIANFRWVWEIFISVTSFYIALFIMDVHYKSCSVFLFSTLIRYFIFKVVFWITNERPFSSAIRRKKTALWFMKRRKVATVLYLTNRTRCIKKVGWKMLKLYNEIHVSTISNLQKNKIA